MRLTCILMFFLLAITASAQTNRLQVNQNIVLPKDSIESEKLTAALDSFLIAAQKSNQENKLVFESEKVETFILLDEINGIQKSKKFNDDYFFKPYLTNVVPLKNSQYFAQVSFIGINERVSILRASFDLIAHKINGSFLFSSPLKRNTEYWKTLKAGNNRFHYQYTINKKKVKDFSELANSFDRKLKSKNAETDYYCCDNLIQLQKLVGVQYKSDYNGEAEGTLSSSSGTRQIVVLGNNNADFNSFDPHDLWHDRLSLIIPRSKDTSR